MSYTKKNLDKSQVELTITITPAEYQKDLEKAAKRLSERASIKGFRKGNVPYEILKKEVGEMSILQEALEPVVQETFFDAVKAEKLETIGMPKIEVEKLAPGNDILYKAIVAIMPSVKLADVKGIKVKKNVKPVGEKELNETFDAVRGMHAVEVVKEGPAEKTDKLVIDMDMFLDNVPVDGGQAKNYQVYLSEEHYIPGFNEQVAGLKKDDEKSFSLEFPKEHYQKHLAGKKIDFKVKVRDVFERQLPELSDELAKKLGQDSMEKLKELITNNMQEEAEHKAEQQVEIELLDAMIEKSTFDIIPDVIIDAEKRKMFFELKHDLEKNGVTLEQYLQDIKKKEDELYNDFQKQAEKRAKAALISRQIAKEHEITVSDVEINGEIAMMKEMYKKQKEMLDRLERPEVRDTIASSIQNKKVMLWLKAKVLGVAMVESGEIDHSGHKH